MTDGARFATDWHTVLDGLEGPVGLAVSGGPDSLALLLLAHAALPPGAFAVATVDHGLRPEAADEAAVVAKICARHGIAHATLTLTLPPGSAVQERARAARYAALEAWRVQSGLVALSTAHHADDQAETMVMRLNRGAGLRGLAAMRPRAQVPGGSGVLLRPLLGWRREALRAVVSAADLSPVEDPSNRDARFERVRVRAGLEGADWIDPAGLARSAAHLAQADAALDWMAARAMADLDTQGDRLAWTPDTPRAVTLRVLEAIIARLSPTAAAPRGGDLARWHDHLAAGRIATLAGVRGDGRAEIWQFAPVRPHRKHD